MENPQDKTVLWRLAHFEPNCIDDYGNQLLEYLILDGLSTFGPNLPVPTSHLKDYIKTTYHLNFEIEEINNSCFLLEKKFFVEIIPTERNEIPIVKIQEEIFSKIDINLRNFEHIEYKIFDDWSKELLQRYGNTENIAKNVIRIKEIFQSFLSKLLLRHGVESVYLLYPENLKAKQWQEKNGSSLFSGLPKTNNIIDSIIRIEFPRFFLKDDPDRRSYIFRVFNSSFLMQLIQVDEKCSHLFKEVTKGQKLFLDNNVLYHLCGFNGSNVLVSSHNMIKYASELGYDLWVTEKTLEEYHGSLIWRMKEYQKCLPITSDLAKIAIENLDQDSFLVTYWRELAEKGTSIEEFVAEKSNIDSILEGLKIQKTNEYRAEIEKSEEYKEAQIILQTVANDYTNPLIIEHDAYHRNFILKLRGSTKYNYQKAIAWFLTTDTKLPVYDRVARKGKDSLPFCLTIDQWIQINRPFISRTSNREDYEKAFQVLVTQPYIRAMVSNQPMENTYQSVLGRLARYENMTQQLAFEIVTDTNFMLSMNKSNVDQNFEEKLHSEFLSLSTKLQQEKMDLLDEVVLLQKRVETIEKNNFEKIEVMQKDLDKEKFEKGESTKEKIKIQEFYKKLVLWLISSFLILFSIFFIYFAKINIFVEIENVARIPIIKFFTLLLSISIFLCIPLHKHWKYLLGTLLVTITSLLLSALIP